MISINSNPLISVIVPVFNVEKYLNRCIDSILSQTYRHLEILLIDDGSNDSSPQICDEYSKKDKRVRTIHKKNGGVSSARNAGLDVASGQFISFIDADDFISNDMYKELIEVYNAHHYDLVKCFYDYYINDTITTKHYYYDPGLIDISDKNSIYSLFKEKKMDAEIWSYLFKKDTIGDLRFKNYGFGEDLLFVITIISKVKSLYITNNSYYHYFINDNGAVYSKKNVSRNMNNIILVNKELRDIILKEQYYYFDFLTVITIYRIIEDNICSYTGSSIIDLIDDFEELKSLINSINVKELTYYQRCFFHFLKNKNERMILFITKIKKRLLRKDRQIERSIS